MELDWEKEKRQFENQNPIFELIDEHREVYTDAAQQVYGSAATRAAYQLLRSVRRDYPDGERMVNVSPLLFPANCQSMFDRLVLMLCLGGEPTIDHRLRVRLVAPLVMLDLSERLPYVCQRLVEILSARVAAWVRVHVANAPVRFIGAFDFVVNRDSMGPFERRAQRVDDEVIRCTRFVRAHAAELGVADDVELTPAAFALLCALNIKTTFKTPMCEAFWALIKPLL